VEKLRRYRCRGEVHARQVPRGEVHASQKHGSIVQPGDWLIQQGAYEYAMPDDVFRALFQPGRGVHPDGWSDT
jgi:hypothetical protein